MADDNGGKLEATDGKEHGKGKGAADKLGKKQGSFFQKYKVWIIVGGLLLLVILYFLLRGKSGSSANGAATNAQDQASQSGVDPSTGYLYGSPADMAALGSSGTVSATPGAPGPAGPPGPKGPAGKTMTLWGLATELARKRFHTKNPTHKEINQERSHLLQNHVGPPPNHPKKPKVNPGGPRMLPPTRGGR